MRNLKRMLTMIMAVAMLMSLMVVGAGAAFPDQDEIKHADAVQKMVSLNIIEGRDDGSFDPTAIVTRGEMAKMICVALNGGNDPKLSSGTVVSFTDTKGHWAEGYIEYCVNMGIVNGLGDGTFGPDQGVTATQAAKMLLVALGYDAEYEKFVGLTWALNVNKTAMQKGLYEDIMGIDANAPMSRDDAAQMLSNFTTTYMVKYEFGIGGSGSNISGVKQAVDTDETVLSKYFKLVEENGQLTKIGYDEKKAEYKYEVGEKPFQSENDYSALFGANVTVMWRDKDNNGNYSITTDSVYDIILNDSSVVATGVMDDFGKYDANKNTLKFADVTYDTEKDDNSNLPALKAFSGNVNLTNVIVDNNGDNAAVKEDSKFVDGAYNVSLLDNDNDGKVDLVVYQPFKVAKVTYAGSTSTTFDNGVGSVDNDDVVLYDGIAKDDLVAYYDEANTTMGKDTVVKLDVQTGTISGVKGSEYLIDGTWYTKASGVTVSLNVNDNIEYVAVGSTLYYAKVVEAGDTTKDVAVVYDVTKDDGFGGVKAKIMLTDGTEKIVTVSKLNGNESFADTDIKKGQMYTYKVDSKGEYELKKLATDNTAGYDGYDTQAVGYNNDDKLLGKDIADDAKIFVVQTGTTVGEGKVKLYTGKEIKNYDGKIEDSSTSNKQTDTQILTTKANGFETVQLATIYAKAINIPEINTGSNYGYLTADAYTSSADGKNYVNYTIWNGTEEVTVKEESTDDVAAYKAGKIVTFDKAGDGLVKNVSIVDKAMVDVVTGYDSSNAKKVAINGTSYDIDSDDTTILYVDTKNTKGVDGGEIQIGQDTDGDGDADVKNVAFLANGTTLELLVVDVNNEYQTAAGDSISLPADNTEAIQDNLNNGANVTVEGAEVKGNLNVPANATLTLAGEKSAVAISGDVTVSGKMIVPEGTKLTVKAPAARATANGLTVEKNGTLQISDSMLVETGATLTNNGTITGTQDADGSNKKGQLEVAGTYVENGTTIVGADANALFTPDANSKVQIGIFDADKGSYKIRATEAGTVTLNKDHTLGAGQYIHVKDANATLKIADNVTLTLTSIAELNGTAEDPDHKKVGNLNLNAGKIVGGEGSKIVPSTKGQYIGLNVGGDDQAASKGFYQNGGSTGLTVTNNHAQIQGMTWDASAGSNAGGFVDAVAG